MKYHISIKLAFLFFIFGISTSSFAIVPKDKALEDRVTLLISKMTLEEKIGQMSQLNCRTNPEGLLPAIVKGEIGSLLNVENREIVNMLQRAAVEKSRLGIPLLIGRDVIHGFKTIFPIPLGQAASFNPEIVERGARIAAIEASANGIRWTFAPMIDIARDPRWGRIAESLGEDPYLASTLGVAMVKGFQGNALNDPRSIAATAKHFFGYGAAEGGRDYNSTNIPERLLRNVYLKPFEAVTKAGVATFMTSFNDNDGVPASANRFMLRDVLRGEWGFDGFVVSDWGSITDMVNHRFCKDKNDAAMKAVNAGLDMEMATNSYKENLPQLVHDQKVELAVLDEAVRNILRIKFRMGLFDNPYTDTKNPQPFYNSEFLADATRAAEQSMVLLKNERNTLPINVKNIKRIAIIGPLADAAYDQMGTWVFDGEKSHTITPLKAIQKQYGSEVEIVYEQGLKYSRDMSHFGFKAAIDAAQSAELVLFFGGEEAILSGEAHSLADLNLQGAQSELIVELKKTNKPLVVVLMAGRPLTIANEAEQADALLYAWHPGTMGGTALANLLFGQVSPSGKLPVTFPKLLGQIPIHYNHFMTGRPAQKTELLLDKIPLEAKQTSTGCTSFYLDAGFNPLYPFGYGLSYSTFKYDNLSVAHSILGVSDTLRISFEITNTGNFDAAEVAQLYITDLVGSIARPVKELKRYERVNLKSGDKKLVEMSLPISELAFYGVDMKNVVEAGDFELMVGGSSENGLKLNFEVKL
jgi:beta-glucosidase